MGYNADNRTGSGPDRDGESGGDDVLYARLKAAIENGDASLTFRAGPLMTPGSPVFAWADAALMAAVAIGLALAPAALGRAYDDATLIGLALVLFVWSRWLWRRARIRATAAALGGLAAFVALWRRGGIGLRCGTATSLAPFQDWRHFVRQQLLP
ncbi:hypothetical protein [Oceanibacterium hippocampi]|uniref:Uncharacterized protein n=1 Tax=Oceanibacterium hippocampi TaxID=745714 RepID=A0A1Y5T5H8_9PROT|nr:hypothetical protein [Oceanibacterium hippocampi]SLN54534.1 hypothetical protein OCH7691_02307 [Oceanibacterium hippocampi]